MTEIKNTNQYRILITGGAGFIGTHLISTLRKNPFYELHIVDNLHPQIHGENAKPNPELLKSTQFHEIDITNRTELIQSISNICPHLVIHLASETGTGQSYDEISRYTNVNIQGTSNLIEALKISRSPVEKIILSSSRAVYGEGPWLLKSGSRVTPPARFQKDLQSQHYSPRYKTEFCIAPQGVNEDDPLSPISIYATTKATQEFLVKQAFQGTQTEVVCLRLQNVFGPGQSIRNPYTGVLMFFINQILKDKKINLYEDGLITRDFVYVDDVVSAISSALHTKLSYGEIINIGSGIKTSLVSAAQTLLHQMNKPQEFFSISHYSRIGDIRSAWADITKAQFLLNWSPKTSFENGLRKVIQYELNQIKNK